MQLLWSQILEGHVLNKGTNQTFLWAHLQDAEQQVTQKSSLSLWLCGSHSSGNYLLHSSLKPFLNSSDGKDRQINQQFSKSQNMDCLFWRVSKSIGEVRKSFLEKVKSDLNSESGTGLSRVGGMDILCV